MVEPTTDTARPGKPASSAPGRPAISVGALVLSLSLAGLSGCGLVPKSRMDECHRVTQTLRAENGRLKDLALELRTQNQDLSQRAVDDARQIAAKDEANERLVKSVQAYQGERDKLAEAYRTLEQQVRMAVNPHPTARAASLKAFASSHPGWSFDEAGMTLSAPPALLFEKGTATLTAAGTSSLRALATELSALARDGLTVEVVGPAPAPPVVRAGFAPAGDDPGGTKGLGVVAASDRFLGAARSARVRDRLVTGAGLGPSRVRIVPPPRPAAVRPGGADRRVEIRVQGEGNSAARAPGPLPGARQAAALDSAPATGR